MESVPGIVKQEVCMKEEPLENCADSSGASEEVAWGPELSVKRELEAGPESTDEMPTVLFELFEDGETTLQSRVAAVKSETRRGAASGEDAATFGCERMLGSGALFRAVSARARQQLAMTCSVRLERLHQCRICYIAFDLESTLTTHMEEMHTDKQKQMKTYHTCKIYLKTFGSKYLFADHSHEKTSEVYSCQICSKVFSSKSALNKHGILNTRRKQYSCKICNKCFARKNSLEEHTRIHTGQKPYKCEICNKQFTLKRALTTHTTIHTGEKPYKCGICDKRFRENSKLIIHTRIHTGEKPYKCQICNKQISDQAYFIRHIKMHTGEKPYQCEICNKRFIENRRLIIHIRTHTGEKPYKCNICKKQFADKSYVHRHMRIHIGRKSYPCEMCGAIHPQSKPESGATAAHSAIDLSPSMKK